MDENKEIPVTQDRGEWWWQYRLLIAEIEALMDECGVPRKAACREEDGQL